VDDAQVQGEGAGAGCGDDGGGDGSEHGVEQIRDSLAVAVAMGI
jgi:hypothetical protein